MNNTFCTFPVNGMFISGRGVGLCCVADKKYQMGPLEFWNSNDRKTLVNNQKDGIEINDCQICYHNQEKGILSHRQIYNSNKNNTIKTLPTKLDLDFSNLCNLKCIMCHSGRSSQWAKELGIHTETNGVKTITDELLKETCELSHNLEELLIQGGEPSIMPEFETYFQYLKDNNLIKNIKLQVISNLTNINTRFFERLKDFKNVRLCVSVDSYGPANDYIRFPSKFEKITENLIKVSEMSNNIEVELFNSIQILSLFNYNKFLDWCVSIEDHFKLNNKSFKIIALKVTEPTIYSLFNAPAQLKAKFNSDIEKFFKSNKSALRGNVHFPIELKLLQKKLLASTSNNDQLHQLKEQLSVLDQRRNIKITNYIPNLHKYV